MKRFFTLLSLLFSLVHAEDLSLGAGPYFQTQPYNGASAIVVPSPVVFYDNGIFYARWTRVGLYFYGHKASGLEGDALSWGFSLTAQPRPNGYAPDDSSALSGLDEKKSSFEGGVAFTLYGKGKYLEMMLMHDLLGYYNGYIAKAEAGFKYKAGDFTFYPSIIVVYEDADFTDYYYGVNAAEAARTPYPYYQPGGGVRFAVQSYISYPLNKEWSLFFNVRADRLSTQARNSPIVEDSFMYSGLASLLYTFDF